MAWFWSIATIARQTPPASLAA